MEFCSRKINLAMEYRIEGEKKKGMVVIIINSRIKTQRGHNGTGNEKGGIHCINKMHYINKMQIPSYRFLGLCLTSLYLCNK